MDTNSFSHDRKFTVDVPDLPGSTSTSETNLSPTEYNDLENNLEKSDLFRFIRQNLIGEHLTVKKPFGSRRVLYCDYTASGRALKCIEEYVQKDVLPYYGNVHSSVTVTSEQSTLFLHEARDIVRNHLKASEKDAVIFTGAGCTAAVELLAHSLNFDQPPVVIVGPFEHHSNLLFWRHLAKRVVRVAQTTEGLVDTDHLRKILQEESALSTTEGFTLIGCFSACSNVTGVLSDVDAITTLLHSYNALAFWDYAACAPYVKIEMNPTSSPLAWKDALYFSGHKFVGGVQSPGVLVAKKSLFQNQTPLHSGGGTVFFVRRSSQVYLKDIENREEGGTPSVAGAARLGLAIKLKDTVGTSAIAVVDNQIIRYVNAKWSKCDRLLVLGPTTVDRLPIYSFIIKHSQSGLYLHHNFVAALLDDLFGIQSRAGCACAGPYGLDLLGIDDQLALEFEDALKEDSRLDRHHLRRSAETSMHGMLRPGFVRVNFPYFWSKQQVDFVADAVTFVAEHGWKFLPMYLLNAETGEFHHRSRKVFDDRKWLGHLKFTSKGLVQHNKLVQPRDEQEAPPSYTDCFNHADLLAKQCSDFARKEHMVADGRTVLDDGSKKLRWFLLSYEARMLLASKTGVSLNFPPPPFLPVLYEVPSGAAAGAVVNGDNIERGIDLLACSSSTNIDESESSFDEPHLENGHSGDSNTQPSNAADQCSSSGVCDVNLESISADWNRRRVFVADPNRKVDRGLWHTPTKTIFRPTIQAILEHNMIRDGDRVLVCLSGGKDSLSLLHVVHAFHQMGAHSEGLNFEFGAITVDPGSAGYDPSSLIDYCQSLNVTYLYEQQNILAQALSLPKCTSICAFCSRMRRGRLVAAAIAHNYNVLAFGQHLDDAVESLLIAAFQNGNLRTMKAHYTSDKNVRVIRPMIYVREKHLRDFAESRNLPIIPENCPACFEAPKERHRIKQMLAGQELLFPMLFTSLRTAIAPLLSITSTDSKQMRAQAAVNILTSKTGDKNSFEDSDPEGEIVVQSGDGER